MWHPEVSEGLVKRCDVIVRKPGIKQRMPDLGEGPSPQQTFLRILSRFGMKIISALR